MHSVLKPSVPYNQASVPYNQAPCSCSAKLRRLLQLWRGLPRWPEVLPSENRPASDCHDLQVQQYCIAGTLSVVKQGKCSRIYFAKIESWVFHIEHTWPCLQVSRWCFLVRTWHTCTLEDQQTAGWIDNLQHQMISTFRLWLHSAFALLNKWRFVCCIITNIS